MRPREKGLGPSKTGNTRGPLGLTSTNWLATPGRLILLRFSHRCPLPLPHNVVKTLLEKLWDNYQIYIKDASTFFYAVWASLHQANSLAFVCLVSCFTGTTLSFIYKRTHTRAQPLSARMYNSAEHSLIFLFFCTMYEFMEICAHRAISIVGSNF